MLTQNVMAVVLSFRLGENTRSMHTRFAPRVLSLSPGVLRAPFLGQNVTVKPTGREHLDWFHQSWREKRGHQIGWCRQRTMSLDYL